MNAARIFLLFCAFTFSLAGGAISAEGRRIVTTPDSDYFGFDLRAEKDVSLDQCEAACLGDRSCRAFTYNTKAKWCFLKSDFSQLKPFLGAVAGKVVPVSGQPDIGAPTPLAFLPAQLTDQARQYFLKITGAEGSDSAGLAALGQAGEAALANGDPRSAATSFTAAAAIAPEDADLWTRLARASLAVQPANSTEAGAFSRDAVSAALNAYQASRSAASRAEALSVLAQALDRREMFRPALQAYEASLALVNSATVRAEYEDLKARKGFRIVDHSIDADTASPRACVQFSEDLLKSGVDYGRFVQVNGGQPASLDIDQRQICIGGLKNGQQYSVAFRAGLPAAIGEVIAAPVALDIYVPDRPASVRFTGDAFVLPSGARRGIPVVSVNMDVADVKLYRIGDRALAQLLSGYQFLRQLDGYEAENIADQLGEPVWQGKLEVGNELNKEVTTSFPVDEALPQRKPGVYVLTAQPENDRSETWNSRATQWFVVSDIGLTTYTGEDGLTVFARSLGSAKPLAGVSLTLLARNNEVLGTATSDAEGRATFSPGLTRGEGGLTPAVLTASREESDFVFLDMTKAGFDLSDRGVAGRDAPGALDVFLWTERGIYRAGETVHAAALARDEAADAVASLPLTFIFTRPDGVEDRRIASTEEAAGGHAVDLVLQPNAMRGTWTVGVYTDPRKPAIASHMFLVEDFVPDRIEFDLSADKTEIAAGETANVTVDGRFLYGAPAAGLAIEGEVALSTTRDWVAQPGFSFGLADEDQGEATVLPLSGLPLVGEDGKASFPVVLDQLPSTTRLVKARVTVRMREAGGRAVERALDLAVQPQGEMIGIRPEFSGGQVPMGGTAGFAVISVDRDGKPIAGDGLKWSLVKVERDYQWYRSDNSWNYEPVTYTRAVSAGTLDLKAGEQGKLSFPVDWGRYRLEIASADPQGPATSVEFDAGWYVAATSTETPDGLEIALDKDTYAPGDVAKLKITPRFAGEALIAIGGERLFKTVTASVPAEGATIDVPVDDDWGAGTYVTATLFRPGEAEASRLPARAIGVKWLKVDPADKKLAVRLETPDKITPRGPLSVPVEVTGAKAGEPAYVTVAAVDVGILNLTGYKAPAPEDWYFGQRKLGLELRDLYGRLIDGSLGAAGRLRTGGDGASMSAEGSPPTEKLVAFFSGIVQLGQDGKATVDFDLPQFNGTVRVMAVAWTKGAVGHAESDVIVRDPVVVTASLPRVLAPGDRAAMRLDITNTDAPTGDYSLAVTTAGGLAADISGLPETLSLEPGKRHGLTIPVTADEAGQGILTLTLSNAAGLSLDQTLTVPIRAPVLPVTTRLVVDLAANGPSLTIDGALLSGSRLDGASVSISVTQAAGFDVPALLMALDRYPYGCTEQLTSRALPLLYLSDLAKPYGMGDDAAALKERVQEAIYKVLANQSSSGSFGLWRPDSGDGWLDAYVTDFLTRAREAGYDVPERGFTQALANLQNSLSYDQDVESRGHEIAYALYVLARNRKASVGDLRYYADTKLEAFSSPMAVAQLAAALALYGDVQRSERLFQAAFTLEKSQPDFDWSRSDYGSALRDASAILALAAESRPEPALVPELVKYVSEARNATDWLSTQDQAWMLLAARALKGADASIALQVNGAPYTGAWSRQMSGSELASNPVTLRNTGKQRVQAVVTALAAPAAPPPAGGDGFAIERSYYRLDGSEANITEAAQNERYLVVLKIRQDNDLPSRILVTDLLPGGFEIDNPALVSSADLSNFPWLERTEAAHVEFRDDRFVAALNRNDAGIFTLAYVVRAVTPGTYALPAANVEDMYRPELSARTAGGMMEVKAQ